MSISIINVYWQGLTGGTTKDPKEANLALEYDFLQAEMYLKTTEQCCPLTSETECSLAHNPYMIFSST
jgi:hypothetical protein